ncbi:MAG: signal peptidase I, partial [Candidatus Omnitrophica bacterium]|nr:signal peptidase I [Candidatus Omnitrophota bacterium]
MTIFQKIKQIHNPWLILTFSFILPGLGQMLFYQPRKGTVILTAYALLLMTGLFSVFHPAGHPLFGGFCVGAAVLLHIWNLFDSFASCKFISSYKYPKDFNIASNQWFVVFMSMMIPGAGHFYISSWLFGVVFLAAALILNGLTSISFWFLVLEVIFSMFVCWHAFYLTSRKIPEEDNEGVLVLVIVLIGTFLGLSNGVFNYVKSHFDTFAVTSDAMAHSLIKGDKVLVYKTPENDFERGGIYVFKHPKKPENFYIQRLAGLSEEFVMFDEGQLLVNREKVTDPPYNHLRYQNQGQYYNET